MKVLANPVVLQQPADIPINVHSKSAGFTPVFLNNITPIAILWRLNDINMNITDINTAVINWPKDIGITNCNIQDDATIAADIATSVLIKSKGFTPVLLNNTTPSAILWRL